MDENRQLEQAHFESVRELLIRRLNAMREENRRAQPGLDDLRREEFQERTEPLLRNLWAADRFEDLVLLSQELEAAHAEEKEREDAERQMAVLDQTLSSPYFARIDLQFDEDEEPEQIYIGRHALWDDRKESLLIHDWRAPIASTFYRFGVGPASYQAPAGKITCQMLLKRQFEIRQGQLIGFFDADTVIQDSFLRRMLAQNASPQMKAIVETIQKDQDAAIRDEGHDLLMVQGAAGSGKTSIAMHRVAYLMYEGLKNPLNPHNILILSPNTVFETYIGAVLPELGESRVSSATLEQLLENLTGSPVQSRAERWEEIHALPQAEAARRREAIEFKSSPDFLKLLDRLIEAVPSYFLPYQDLSYGGKIVADRHELRQCAMETNSAFPLAVRLRRLEILLWGRVHALRPARMDELRMLAFRLDRGEESARGYSIWESGVLARQMRAVTRLDYRSIYFRFLNDEALLRRLCEGLNTPNDLSLLKTSQDGPLSLEDAAAIAYLMLKMDLLSAPGDIRQVVVDEAQDYSPVDFAVLNLLFPKARFTVVGDVNQSLERRTDRSLYDGVAKMLHTKSAALIELTKSFRCTKEILSFSAQFLPAGENTVESLNRSGASPQVLFPRQIEEEIAACRAAGYQSIALITKTARDAARWQKRLAPSLPVRLIGRDARVGDVFVVPLPLSKGLEFDAVLVLDCDKAHFGGPEGKRLLYVACTRALHRLALISETGEIASWCEKEENHA